MNFCLLQLDLLPALQAVSRSCGVRSRLPVLGNILIQAKEGRLKLSATNLEIGVVKNLNAEVAEEGEITVPAKTLLEMVANLSGSKLQFSAEGENLKITTSTFSSSLNGISAAEFPAIPLGGKEAATASPKVILRAVPEVAFAAAVDEGRPILTGVLTEIKNSKLELVATDGYRLAHKVVATVSEAGANSPVAFKALIPRRTFEEVARLISEEEVEQVNLSTTDDQNQIVFTLGNTQLSSRLIEGQFPAWEKIIPTKMRARIIVDRAEALKAVKLASVFAKNEANVVKLQNRPGKVVLTSEAKELGSQQNEVEAQAEGEEMAVAFNARYLTDALSAASSSQVILEFSGPLSAALIKPMGEEGLEYIIMPVNLG